MKKMLRRLAAAFLALALMIPTAGAAGGNSAGETIVRIGLASSASGSKSEELIGANLWNVEEHGSGFRFGYFDDHLDFVELARTEESMWQISVIKSQNTWFIGMNRNTYSNTDNGGTVVGSYNLKLPGSYVDYDQARTDAELSGGFVAYINDHYEVRAGSYTTEEEAAAASAAIPNSQVVTTGKYGMNVIQNGTSDILFQYDVGKGGRLAIMPDLTGFSDPQCWFRGLKYRGAFTYERIGGGELTVVNVLELEDYIKGVVPYEMGRSWPLEALKTQAICARTYAMRLKSRHSSLGFDLCPSDHCQVYNGVGNDSTSWGESKLSKRAVEETAGQVLRYKNRLAETVYSSSHGGASEDAKYIWGTDTDKEYPYLCGVVDPYEKYADDINGRAHWKVTYSRGELNNRLHGKGYGVNASIDHMTLHYSELGNVIRLEVYWDNGQKNSFKPGGIRGTFGLNSIRFTVNGKTAHPGEGGENSGEGVRVNGADMLTSFEDLYVITGYGSTGKASSDLYAVSGRGDKAPLMDNSSKPVDPSLNAGGGTVEVSGSSYTFEGAGWGHQVGMSQFGAYAMAEQGFTYDKICEFYFPGTHVGSI